MPRRGTYQIELSNGVASLCRQFELQADASSQNREEVRELFSVLDAAAARIGVDPDVCAVAPELYLQGSSFIRLEVGRDVSGSGASPRPFLHHTARLVSRHAPLMNLSVISFVLHPSYLRRMEEPMVPLHCEPRGWNGSWNLKELFNHLFPVGAGKPLPDDQRRDALLERFARRVEANIERFLHVLPAEFPTGKERKIQRTSVGFYVPLFPTSLLCPKGPKGPKGSRPEEVGERYGEWLKSIIVTWFLTEPDLPLARLIMEAAVD